MAQFYYKNGSSWINALNLFYPIGAIYASTTSTSPGTLFGGTWEQISNAALRAATSSIASYTGSDTHTLTLGEIPNHRHALKAEGNTVGTLCGWNNAGSGGDKLWYTSQGGARNIFEFIGKWTDYTGGGQHILSCNAPTTVICGGEQPRIEVAA